MHPSDVVRRRARYNTITAPRAKAFLRAHPQNVSKVPSQNLFCDAPPPRPAGLRGFLPYAKMPSLQHEYGCKRKSILNLQNRLGSFAPIKHSVKWICKKVCHPVGLCTMIEAPLHVPLTCLKANDLLVPAPPKLAGDPPILPMAYKLAARSLYISHTLPHTVFRVAGAAERECTDKVRFFERTIRHDLLLSLSLPLPTLNCIFEPLAFDAVGTPS